MTMVLSSLAAVNCRTYVVPTCETSQSTTSTTVPIADTFQIRRRDVLDFTVDARQFLASTSPDIQLVSATAAVASSVTMAGVVTGAPTIVGTAFDAAGIASFVIQANAAAAVGDIYSIDVTMTTSQTNIGVGLVLPARVIVRRLAFIVVAG